MNSLAPPLLIGEGLGNAFLLSLLFHLLALSYPIYENRDTHDIQEQRLTVFLSPARQASSTAPMVEHSLFSRPANDLIPSTPLRQAWPLADNPPGKPEAILVPEREEIDALSTEEPARYFPNRLLDQPTVPVSGPDPDVYLRNKTGLPMFPIRLRLYVDTVGKVRKVDLLGPAHVDPERLVPIQEMFMATRFIPGRIKETRLPSYLDIEIDVSDYLGNPGRR